MKLPETTLSPELDQVDPAAPPCVRDLVKASYPSIHTPLSHSLPPRHCGARCSRAERSAHSDAAKQISGPAGALCSDTHRHLGEHVPHGCSSEVLRPFLVRQQGLLPSSIPQRQILECVVLFWWTDRARWVMKAKIIVQEKHNTVQTFARNTHSHSPETFITNHSICLKDLNKNTKVVIVGLSGSWQHVVQNPFLHSKMISTQKG